MSELFAYEFMQNAFFAGMIIAVMASVMGSFIVLRRYAMISDTLAHVSLVGVAVGLLMGNEPLWSAVIVALLVAWLIEYLRFFKAIYSDSVMAIFLSGSLAVAIIIVSLAGAFNSSLFAYLFGNILSVQREEIYMMLFFALLMFAFIGRYYHQLFFIALDEEVAQTTGIKVGWLNMVQISFVAILVALSLRVVGSLLIGALMIIPTVTAMQFHFGFFKTMLLSTLLALFSVVVGLIASYYLSVPSGAAIVSVALLLFILALFKKS